MKRAGSRHPETEAWNYEVVTVSDLRKHHFSNPLPAFLLLSAVLPPNLFRMASTSKRQNGLTIRHLRIKSGMKPGEFATQALISYSTLDNIENERKNASPEVLYRIAKALDVPVHAIIRDPALFAQDIPA